MGEASQVRRLMLYLPNLDGGGAEGVMVNLANGLVGLGYRVDLVLAARAPDVRHRLSEDPVMRLWDAPLRRAEKANRSRRRPGCAWRNS